MTQSRAGARDLGYESWFLDFPPPERPISDGLDPLASVVRQSRSLAPSLLPLVITGEAWPISSSISLQIGQRPQPSFLHATPHPRHPRPLHRRENPGSLGHKASGPSEPWSQ